MIDKEKALLPLFSLFWSGAAFPPHLNEMINGIGASFLENFSVFIQQNV